MGTLTGLGVRGGLYDFGGGIGGLRCLADLSVCTVRIAQPVSQQVACWPWIGANLALGALYGKPGPPQDIEALLDAQASD